MSCVLADDVPLLRLHADAVVCDGVEDCWLDCGCVFARSMAFVFRWYGRVFLQDLRVVAMVVLQRWVMEAWSLSSPSLLVDVGVRVVSLLFRSMTRLSIPVFGFPRYDLSLEISSAPFQVTAFVLSMEKAFALY